MPRTAPADSRAASASCRRARRVGWRAPAQLSTGASKLSTGRRPARDRCAEPRRRRRAARLGHRQPRDAASTTATAAIPHLHGRRGRGPRRRRVEPGRGRRHRARACSARRPSRCSRRSRCGSAAWRPSSRCRPYRAGPHLAPAVGAARAARIRPGRRRSARRRALLVAGIVQLAASYDWGQWSVFAGLCVAAGIAFAAVNQAPRRRVRRRSGGGSRPSSGCWRSRRASSRPCPGCSRRSPSLMPTAPAYNGMVAALTSASGVGAALAGLAIWTVLAFIATVLAVARRRTISARALLDAHRPPPDPGARGRRP